jgi:hypothetical protein
MNYFKFFVLSIPSPSLWFYSFIFTKKKNPFSLQFSQSYQGARLNFKKNIKMETKRKHKLSVAESKGITLT